MTSNAFITGGSRGIGRAVVLKFAAAGINCAFTYRREAEAAEQTIRAAAAGRAKVKAYRLEVSDPDAVEAVFGEAAADFGDLHFLVNNAGMVINNAAVMTTNEEWQTLINANLSGAFYAAREFLMQALAHKQGGRIVALSSMVREGASGQAAYAASKAGLVGLTLSLAKEYGPKGIGANVIAPGFIETEMTDAALGARLKDYWLKFCPLRRSGTVEDVANLVYFLCSPEGSFVNAQVINITGGLDFAP